MGERISALPQLLLKHSVTPQEMRLAFLLSEGVSLEIAGVLLGLKNPHHLRVRFQNKLIPIGILKRKAYENNPDKVINAIVKFVQGVESGSIIDDGGDLKILLASVREELDPAISALRSNN